MTMEDAFLLAQHIERHVPGVTVVAIGRFVPAQSITDQPWKVSVIHEFSSKLKVIDGDEELREWLAGMPVPEKAEGMLF